MSEKAVYDTHMDDIIILTCKHLTNIRTHNIRILIVCYSFDKKNISEGDAARTCRYSTPLLVICLITRNRPEVGPGIALVCPIVWFAVKRS